MVRQLRLSRPPRLPQRPHERPPQQTSRGPVQGHHHQQPGQVLQIRLEQHLTVRRFYIFLLIIFFDEPSVRYSCRAI